MIASIEPRQYQREVARMNNVFGRNIFLYDFHLREKIKQKINVHSVRAPQLLRLK